MAIPIAKTWTFSSDSNPDVEYETLLMVDRSTSCNCPGWTRRVDAQGRRSCKHTRMVDQGIADRRCASMVDYTKQDASVRQAFELSVKPESSAAGVSSTKVKRRLSL